MPYSQQAETINPPTSDSDNPKGSKVVTNRVTKRQNNNFL